MHVYAPSSHSCTFRFVRDENACGTYERERCARMDVLLMRARGVRDRIWRVLSHSDHFWIWACAPEHCHFYHSHQHEACSLVLRHHLCASTTNKQEQRRRRRDGIEGERLRSRSAGCSFLLAIPQQRKSTLISGVVDGARSSKLHSSSHLNTPRSCVCVCRRHSAARTTTLIFLPLSFATDSFALCSSSCCLCHGMCRFRLSL